MADSNVIALTKETSAAIYELIGHYPHVIINMLHRTKLDPNREKNQAAQGVPDANKAWDDYYGFINKSKSTFQGPGLLVDIHGQSHPIVRTELGYLLSAEDLDRNILNPDISSLRSLAGRVTVSFEEILRGQTSIGGLLESNGNYSAVPSPVCPGPDGHPYFTGEYTIEIAGSRYQGEVDAVMAESAWPYRTDAIRPAYAKALAKTIVTFMKKYYLLDSHISQGEKVTSIYSVHVCTIIISALLY